MIRMFLCSQQQRPQRPEMGGDWLNLSMHQGSRKPELDGDHHDCLCFCSQEQRSWRPEVGGDLRIYQTNWGPIWAGDYYDVCIFVADNSADGGQS